MDWEPNCLLLVPSPSVVTYYRSLMLCGSEADKAQIWRYAITGVLVFALVSFVAAALGGIFKTKTADLAVVVDGVEASVPRPDHLARWIDELVFLSTVKNMVFDPVLAFVGFHR